MLQPGDHARIPGIPWPVKVLDVQRGCGRADCTDERIRFIDPITEEEQWMHAEGMIKADPE